MSKDLFLSFSLVKFSKKSGKSYFLCSANTYYNTLLKIKGNYCSISIHMSFITSSIPFTNTAFLYLHRNTIWYSGTLTLWLLCQYILYNDISIVQFAANCGNLPYEIKLPIRDITTVTTKNNIFCKQNYFNHTSMYKSIYIIFTNRYMVIHLTRLITSGDEVKSILALIIISSDTISGVRLKWWGYF